ncbi:hypothetical protein PTKIN_Ptkin03bG0042000 [Pterospermum kingtungense]
MTNRMKSASAIIVNTMDFLEQATLSKIKENYHAPIFTIGPFHKLAPNICSSLFMEDANCIPWLNKQAQKSVIYVSFGSLASINEQELIETAWGLSNSKQPFLWAVRPGLVQGSEWIESLPNGFKESVGGRGCIVKWKPQKEVLAHIDVGLKLQNKLERGHTERAIKRLMVDAEGEEIRKKAMKLKEKAVMFGK